MKRAMCVSYREIQGKSQPWGVYQFSVSIDDGLDVILEHFGEVGQEFRPGSPAEVELEARSVLVGRNPETVLKVRSFRLLASAPKAAVGGAKS